jgi:sialic acid synthase SpsE/mannose-6-phosphate isomerase-like protein (cupin superfamily)
MHKNIWPFQNLFVFDVANNHMGDVEHGLTIIRALRSATEDLDFPCAVKFQYRDLDTFIHPNYRDRLEFKYVKRFQETRLSDDELFRLKQEVDKLKFISMCTPFDERSVDKIVDFNFDVIKVASCSFTDWPLLEKIAGTDKPVIASTAGASLDEIDRVVVFLRHRRKQFAIMHCVGEYPTSTAHLDLNQIEFFKGRYPDVTIGYSTHEDPDNLGAIKIAVAKGGEIFERHVGVATEKYSLNAYSSTPAQVRQWMSSAQEALAMCGISGVRRGIYEKERIDLRGLMRGVFAREDIAVGRKVTLENTFFAIPNLDGQIVANDMSKYSEFVARANLRAGEPVYAKDVSVRDIREYVLNTIGKVRQMLIENRVHLPHMLHFELSHHYGIEQLEDWGAIIINCVNRRYCKKLIVMLPGQRHPAHFHKRKEETFQILSGELILDLGQGEKVYHPGDIVLVKKGSKHGFRSENGTIFEEVSSTHYPDDSYYDDQEILKNNNRKTKMTFWTDWLCESLK